MKTFVTAALLGALLVPSTAQAKGDCPARKGTLAKNALGRVWHQRASVYGCTTVYGHAPRARRMGPYKPGTKVAFDGVRVAFTVPLVRDGVRSDRVYAGDVDDGDRWLLGRVLVPKSATGPEREARIQRLAVHGLSAGWVTTTGEVVMAVRSSDGEPDPIGTLPGPLKGDRDLVLVGRFPDAGAPALAQSMQLKEGQGEGDECGGSIPYSLTVKPDPSAGRIGASWFGQYTNLNC